MFVDPPSVSVIIPCLNERGFIGRCLDSIIANDHPKDKLEVLVVDGMSSDGTRSSVEQYAQRYPFIRMLDNPKKIKPRALNIGIQEAKGSIIIRMDAHAVYEPDYISKSVKYLHEYNADNVGGIRRTLAGGGSVIARAIAYSISHPFAAGNATFRTGSQTMKWVDTVFGGCYRKEVFEKIGLFDEALIRGQDREFNVRLRRAGGRILLAPDIVCYYFARNDLRDFLAWIFVGGLTPFYISRITGKVIFSWRNLVPLAFVLTLVATLLLSLLHSLFLWIFGGIVAVYLVASVVASLPVARKEKDFRFLVIMPFIFATTHIAYGIGSLIGLFKPVERQSEWSAV